MRLIDADKLKEYLRKEKRWCVKSPDGEYENEGFTYDKVFFLTDMQQTIEAVPVVHGKWMHDEFGANFCSECMKYAYEDDEYHMIWHTQYCPHCGAKMNDGREQNEDL